MKKECYRTELKPRNQGPDIHIDYKGLQSLEKIILRNTACVRKAKLLQCHPSACFWSNWCSAGWKMVVSGVTTGKSLSPEHTGNSHSALHCLCYVCFGN